MDKAILWDTERKRGPVSSTGAKSIRPKFESLHKIRLQEMSRNARV
jgi:hypothetical protein